MYGPSLDHGELIGGGHFLRTSSIPEQMLRILRLAFRRAMIVAKVALRLRSPFGIARTPLNMSWDTHAKANLSAVFVRQLNLLIGSHMEGIDTIRLLQEVITPAKPALLRQQCRPHSLGR
jgi:hypothetical protein